MAQVRVDDVMADVVKKMKIVTEHVCINCLASVCMCSIDANTSIQLQKHNEKDVAQEIATYSREIVTLFTDAIVDLPEDDLFVDVPVVRAEVLELVMG